MDNTKEKVITNAIWRIGERIGASLVTFIVSVVLARMLSPKEYGVIAIVIVFTTILQVFVDSGLGKSLIQKKDATDLDFSTVLIFNVISSIVLYILLFLFAPYIESFFSIPGLCSLIRVSGTLLVISGIKNVIQSYIMRNMQFKLFFFATLVGTILSGVVALVMAYYGFGVWALVAQLIINPLFDTLFLCFLVDWKPSLSFSFSRFRLLFSFGWKLLLVDLLNEFFNSIRTFFIGKFYTTSDLGCYENGRKLPTSIYSNLDSALRSVVFPVLSMEQSDLIKTKQYMLKMIKICCFVTTPILFGMAACSENIVRLIWTDKWIEAVPYMQISCAVWSLNSIQALNQQVILAQGRSDICLKIEIINKCLVFVTLMFAIKYGVMAIALSQLIATFLGLFTNLIPNIKLINCSMYEQFKSCSKEFALAFIMAICVYLIGKINMDIKINLILQIIAGAIIYMVPAMLLKFDGYTTISNFLKEKVLRK